MGDAGEAVVANAYGIRLCRQQTLGVAETMDAPRGADLKQVAERLHRDHPEADSSSEEIAEVL